MPQSPMMIAEVGEAHAPPEIASIFADLRRLTAAPMVALIWRHLATFPGLLPEVWRALAPLLESGRMQSSAWHVAATSVTGPPAATGRAALAAAGIDAAAVADLSRVVDAYNRVNPVNFLAVRLLVQAMQAGPGAASGASVRVAVPAPSKPWQPPAAIAPLPPLQPVAALAGEPRRMIDALTADPIVDRATLVPTLYRHLPQCPGLIPLIHAALLPRFRSGEVAAAIAAVTAAMEREAARFLPELGPISALRQRPELLPVLERFSALIPEMVVVGVLLRRGIDQD